MKRTWPLILGLIFLATLAVAQAQFTYTNADGSVLKDPTMKETIQPQQKEMLSSMTEKNYAKFFADLKLVPDQTATLKDLLLTKKLLGSEMGMAMLSAGTNEAKQTEIVQQDKAKTAAVDAQIRQFLGDERFSQLQKYDQTEPDRAAVEQFEEQLRSSQLPLTAVQEQRLVQVTAEERKKFKFTVDFVDHSKATQDLAAMFTEDKVNQFIQDQSRLDQQYLARAQSFLSADQFSLYQQFLDAQRQVRKRSLLISGKIFRPNPGKN